MADFTSYPKKEVSDSSNITIKRNEEKSVMGMKPIVSLNQAKSVIVSEIVRELQGLGRANAVYLEGAMGVGKSSIFREVRNILSRATGKDWGFVDLRLATLSASDLQGIPFAVQTDNGENVLAWLKDAVLPGVDSGNTEDFGIVLLDELNQVKDSMVKSIMYQLLLDRKINDYTLPTGWFVCAAGNREEDGGVYERLLAPVRDRMMILEVNVDPKDTLEFFRASGFHYKIISFIEKNLDTALQTYNPELESDGDDDCYNYLYVTPRTWEFVDNVLKSYENLRQKNNDYTDDDSIIKNVVTDETLFFQITGLMGFGAGKAFFNHYKTEEIDINSILNLVYKNNQVPSGLNNINVGSSEKAINKNISNKVKSGSTWDELKSICKWLACRTEEINTYVLSDIKNRGDIVFNNMPDELKARYNNGSTQIGKPGIVIRTAIDELRNDNCNGFAQKLEDAYEKTNMKH